MSDHYGIWSLLPPLLAIGLAMATRRVVLSLLAGVLAGTLILAGGNPARATIAACEDFLWPALTSDDHLRVFAFTLAMGAMVGLIHRNGGMLALVYAVRPWATNRRRGQLAGWLLGLIVFFDDYANTLLLGTTLRPVTDDRKISREKLAYIVDSTAATVAGIALVSTWVATEVGLIKSGLADLGVAAGSDNAFDVFVATIAYRFYPLLTLLFVGMVAWTGRDFGPMLRAERRALDGQASRARLTQRGVAAHRAAAQPSHWSLAVVPVLAVIIVLVSLLYITGRAAVGNDAGLWQIFGNGSAYIALLYASLVGLATAWLMALWPGGLTMREIGDTALGGAQWMLPALAVLWMAWSLAEVVSSPTAGSGPGLGTARFLGDRLSAAITPQWVPTIVFVLASSVAFCTGTSWGTMGLLTPLIITTTWQILIAAGTDPTIDDPIFRASIGGVLAGAIFGDHCSPISDTTILSSRACDCDHVAHVWTQLPYAVLVAVVSIVCGTIPVGLGMSVWPALGLAAIVLLAALLLIGRHVESPTEDDQGIDP